MFDTMPYFGHYVIEKGPCFLLGQLLLLLLAMSYGRTLPLHLYVILFLFMCGPTFNIRCGENLLNEKIIDTQGVVVCLSDISSRMTFCPEMFLYFSL